MVAVVLLLMVQKIVVGMAGLAVMVLVADFHDFQMVLPGHALHFQRAVRALTVWVVLVMAFRQRQPAFQAEPGVFQDF